MTFYLHASECWVACAKSRQRGAPIPMHDEIEIFLVSTHRADGATLVQACFALLGQAEEFAGRQLCHLVPGERLHVKAIKLQGLAALPKSNLVVDSVLQN